MRKEYETTLIIDGEIQGASIPRAPRGVAAKYRADPGYRVTDVVGDETVAILYIETVKQERTQCPPEYELFLDALYRAPNAVACGMCERRAHEFGKTVREVCADFKAKYGGYL